MTLSTIYWITFIPLVLFGLISIQERRVKYARMENPIFPPVSIELLVFIGLIVSSTLINYCSKAGMETQIFYALTANLILLLPVVGFTIYKKTPTFLIPILEIYSPKNKKHILPLNRTISAVNEARLKSMFLNDQQAIYMAITSIADKDKVKKLLLSLLLFSNRSHNRVLESIEEQKNQGKKHLKGFYVILIFSFILTLIILGATALNYGIQSGAVKYENISVKSEFVNLIHYVVSCISPINKAGVIPLNHFAYFFDILIIFSFLPVVYMFFQLLSGRVDTKIDHAFHGYANTYSDRIKETDHLIQLTQLEIFDEEAFLKYIDSNNDSFDEGLLKQRIKALNS